MLKKFILLALLVGSLTACSGSEKPVLKVFNWGAYIDDSVIADFEDEYGVRVIYDTYDSNELMYTKLASGEKYDILVPTDHMVERLIAEDKLQELDLSKIPNLANVDPGMLNRPFDPNNVYSLPYFYGNIGVIYNKNNVDIADLETQGWNFLHDAEYVDRVYVYDSARDAFMMAYKSLGYSINTTDEAKIEEAFQWLQTMNDVTRPIYIDETLIDNMINGEKDLAVTFSGDAAYVLSENEDMSFFVPAEGTNLWTDSMVIPADAPNPDLAHKWINFMLDNAVAQKNTEYVGYTSPVVAAFDAVTASGGIYFNNPAYAPRLNNPLDEVHAYSTALVSILSDRWTRVKAD
jgi:spermidine/putrescine transport system substrate-binding protein